MPTSTVENYLKTLYVQQQSQPGEQIAMGKLARAMDVAPGTATAMVKTLSEADLVHYEPRGGVLLTATGENLALHVLRRHRLVELFLVQVLGLDWSEVHEEAEQLEHAISDKVMEELDRLLGHPQVDPHGDPIPTAGGELPPRHLKSLADDALPDRITVMRITDQDPDFLQYIERAGLTPGTSAVVVRRDHAGDSVTLRPDGGDDITLGGTAAAKILVEAVAVSHTSP